MAGDRIQVELIQIERTQWQEQAPTANIRRTKYHLVRELILNPKVEVVGSRRSLRAQHGVQRRAQIVPQTRRRVEQPYNSIGEWITQRVDSRCAWCRTAGGSIRA